MTFIPCTTFSPTLPLFHRRAIDLLVKKVDGALTTFCMKDIADDHEVLNLYLPHDFPPIYLKADHLPTLISNTLGKVPGDRDVSLRVIMPPGRVTGNPKFADWFIQIALPATHAVILKTCSREFHFASCNIKWDLQSKSSNSSNSNQTMDFLENALCTISIPGPMVINDKENNFSSKSST